MVTGSVVLGLTANKPARQPTILQAKKFNTSTKLPELN